MKGQAEEGRRAKGTGVLGSLWAQVPWDWPPCVVG